MQAKLWTPNRQAGWNGGYHLQASTKLIIKCRMVEAGPHSLQASSLGCGQGQQCWMTEEGCFYWQFWHLLYSSRGVGELRKRQVQKAGASLYLSGMKAARFGQSSYSAAEEPLVWGNAETERAEQRVSVCAYTCACVHVCLGGKLKQCVVLNWLNQVTLIAWTLFLCLSKKVPVCSGKIKLVFILLVQRMESEISFMANNIR